MDSKIEAFILELPEEKRTDYFTLRQFILDCSPEIIDDFKYGAPFFTSHGLLAYINEDRKRRKFYLGLCQGKQLNDASGILIHERTSVVSKWYYDNRQKLDDQAEALKALVLEGIIYNKARKRK